MLSPGDAVDRSFVDGEGLVRCPIMANANPKSALQLCVQQLYRTAGIGVDLP